MKGPLKNYLYRLTVWPLAICSCKNLCKKSHIYWSHVLRSWSVTPHSAIFMRAHRSHVRFQHREKLAFRSTSLASTSGHYKSYNCCSFSFCSGPCAPQSQMDDLRWTTVLRPWLFCPGPLPALRMSAWLLAASCPCFLAYFRWYSLCVPALFFSS